MQASDLNIGFTENCIVLSSTNLLVKIPAGENNVVCISGDH